MEGVRIFILHQFGLMNTEPRRRFAQHLAFFFAQGAQGVRKSSP